MNAIYPRTSSLAVVSLIFGILAFTFLPFLGAIIAVVCGHAARAEIRRAQPGGMEGDGMALAGLILGWIQLVLVVLVVGFFVLVLAGAVALGGWH